MDEAFTFDDVLIRPAFSELASRKDVDLHTYLKSIRLEKPIISSNMASITEETMAVEMNRCGGLGILHRFCTIERNLEMFRNTRVALRVPGKQYDLSKIGVSIGITDEEKERALALVGAGANIICVDVAHGAQRGVVNQVLWLRETFKNDVQIIVGNFATFDSIKDFSSFFKLNDENRLIFKVGIGPGSACTTRIKTGVGVPQLSAIMECSRRGSQIIADGGMRTPGDIAKALAAGASAVMIGGMFAGTDEAPGKITEHGITYKAYKGSASGGYGNGWKTSEGVEFLVTEKGPVKTILNDIEGGLRSALTYVGAANLDEFQKKAQFIRVSNSTVLENTAHGAKNV